MAIVLVARIARIVWVARIVRIVRVARIVSVVSFVLIVSAAPVVLTARVAPIASVASVVTGSTIVSIAKGSRMCGIFGGIGKNLNPGIIRALAIVNRERGTDSLGFFGNTGKMCKRVGDPIDCLGDDDFADFIDKSCHKGWFLAGHTRLASHGKANTHNAHPFRFGRIVGCHNGCVSIPKHSNYAVDSEYLFDSLNQEKGDYQKAFADIKGYWGLAWFNGESFFLQSHDNEVAVGCDDTGNWYYSSDWTHLEACTGPLRETVILSEGATIRWTLASPTFERMPDFVSNVPRLPAIVVVTCGAKLTKKQKKARRAKRGSHAERVDKAEHDVDPFSVGYDETDPWARAGVWEDYCENDERLD